MQRNIKFICTSFSKWKKREYLASFSFLLQGEYKYCFPGQLRILCLYCNVMYVKKKKKITHKGEIYWTF